MTVTAVIDTRAGSNLVKTDCKPRAWAGNVVTTRATCWRSATNTHLEVKGVIRYEVQPEQEVAKVGFTVVTDMATDMILGTANIEKDIEKMKLEKSTLRSSSPSSIAIEESVENAIYIANNVETKKRNPREDYNKYLCTAVFQKIIPPRSEVHLHLQSDARGVRLVASHGNLVKNCQTVAAQGLVEVVSTNPFIIMMAN